MIKLLLGAIVAFLVGAGCRYFDIPDAQQKFYRRK